MVVLVWSLMVRVLRVRMVLGRWLSAVIECSSLVDLLSCRGWGHLLVLPCGGARAGAAGAGAAADRWQPAGEVVPYEIVGRRAREPQGPGERPPPLCELETTRVGVQVCPSARQPMTRVRDKITGSTGQLVPGRHDA
jgi:hypothetical protein